MPLAGMGYGAGQALEEIVAQRILAQKLEQAITERQQQASMEQQRIDESTKHNQWERGRAEKLDAERATERQGAADLAATERRGLSNMAGVMSMGLDPQTAKREIAYSARDPKLMMEAMEPPKVERDPIKDYRERKEIDKEFEKPPQGARPGTHVINGRLVDDTGKVIYDGGGRASESVHPVVLDYSRGIIRKIDDLIGRQDDPATPQNESKPNRVTQSTAGVGGAVRRMAPWNNAAKDVDAELFSLTSGLAISALQKMRASSKSGGAVGNVALGEMEIMKNAEAAIRSDQSPANLRRQLGIIRESEQRFLDVSERDSRQADPGLNRGIGATPDDLDKMIDSLRGKPKGQP